MKLSVVSTLYRSSAHIEEFCRRSAQAAQTVAGDDYEIILVNDGSPDDSLEKAVRLSRLNDRLIVVDLSRNFGHHRALMTGLAYARGERVFLIDSDLEEEPEWLGEFSRDMAAEPCDVVFGVQESRKGGLFERLSGWLFYTIFSILTGVELPRNWVTARLLTRRYVDALLQHGEREIFIGGLYLLAGFQQRPRTVSKRSSSATTYTLDRKIAAMVNAITCLSSRPLIGIFYIGVLIFISAAIYTLYLILNRLFLSTPLTGWTSLMASIWLLGGLMISFIGIIGVYLSKVFVETKQRPPAIIREVYGDPKRAIPRRTAIELGTA